MGIRDNKIKIHQTLHGYDNGHSMLASSVDALPEAKRTLLIMSDMSGPSMQSGFEEYLTGYPLKEMNAFALSKTWYAPEMKRPGCVWTHTLLINFSDLQNVNNFQDLVDLFKRPDPKSPDFLFYKNFIEVPGSTSRYL